MLLRRAPFQLKQCVQLSTVAEPMLNLEIFRTQEINPANHTVKNCSRFYTIPLDTKKTVFTYGGLPKSFEKQVKTFNEACLMVREPAVEIISHINNTNFNNATNRFVVYGENGAGKSLTLAHLLHFGFDQQFLLIHVPWVPNWFKKPKEIANSSTIEGSIDLPLDAAAWLIHFKTQNAKLLAKLDLKVSKDYVWSKRETTPVGASLSELIDHGINRVKFACDTVAALIYELKNQSNEGKCKTMVVIDGYNAFFHSQTRILTENKVRVTPDKVTLTKPFLDITKYDWKNGVCILGVDKIALTDDKMESELPLYLLGREGFEHLDPFIPIRVENYSEKEYATCIQYYLDRKWIQTNEAGFDKELEFLSGRNPFKLMELCKGL